MQPRSRFATHPFWQYAALACALGGCGASGASSSADAVRFDPCARLILVSDGELSTAATAGVLAGIDFWNREAHARLSLAASVESSSVGADPTLPIHFQAAGAPFHGLYDPAAAQIFINTDLSGHDQAVAVAHEVGHAFGLTHVAAEERRSVMNAGNLDEEPNQADVAALTTLWGACVSSGAGTAVSAPGQP